MLDTSEIMQTAASGRADELRDEMRARALSSLYYFSKVVMGFKDLSPTFHLPRAQEVQDSIPLRQRGFLWPRAHFKSTIITKCYIVWRLVGGGYEDFDYNDSERDPRNKRWLLAGESDGRVTDAVKNLKWHFQNNQLLQWLFPEIIPADFNKTTWRDDALLLPRSRSFDEPSIRAVGVGTKITGYHGDGFVFDDIIGEKAAKSEADMKAANDWLDYLPGLINDPRDFEVLFAGTRWKYGTADTYGYLMDRQPFEIDSETQEPRGIKWFVHSAITSEGEIAFPERFTFSILADIQRRQGDYKFSCQYLNVPSTPESADFPPSKVHSFRVEPDEKGHLTRIIPDDGTPPVTLRELARITFFDPSSGGQSAECENAIVVLGTASDGRQFALDAILRNCGYRAAIEYWHLLNDKFQCARNHYEAVGAQKTIEEFITQRQMYLKCALCGKFHRKLIPIGIKPPGGQMNKDERIRHFLQPTVEEGKLYLNARLIHLRQQIVAFPHFKLKDGIDALAYAVHHSSRPSTNEEVEDMRAELAAAQQPKPPRVIGSRNYGGYV